MAPHCIRDYREAIRQQTGAARLLEIALGAASFVHLSSPFPFSFSLPGAPAVRFLQSTTRRCPASIKSSPSPRFADHQPGRSSVRGVHPHRNHRGLPSPLRPRRSPSSSASSASTFCSAVCAASVSSVPSLSLCDLDASSLAYFNTAKRGAAPSLTSNLLSLLFPPHYATPTPNVHSLPLFSRPVRVARRTLHPRGSRQRLPHRRPARGHGTPGSPFPRRNSRRSPTSPRFSSGRPCLRRSARVCGVRRREARRRRSGF